MPPSGCSATYAVNLNKKNDQKTDTFNRRMQSECNSGENLLSVPFVNL